MKKTKNRRVICTVKNQKKVCLSIDRKKYKKNFAMNHTMLKYFQEESQFRQRHYWNFLINSFILVVSISAMPIASEIIGIKLKDIPQDVKFCFPALSAYISLLCFFVLNDEAKKIKAVNEAKYTINRNLMDPQYRYIFYNNAIGKASAGNKTVKTKKYRWLVFKMPYLTIISEFLILGGIVWILYNN